MGTRSWGVLEEETSNVIYRFLNIFSLTYIMLRNLYNVMKNNLSGKVKTNVS